MKVTELIELLGEVDPEAEVRFVYQENYPLQDHIAGVWDASEAGADPTYAGKVYLVSAGQVYDQPYGPPRAFAEVAK